MGEDCIHGHSFWEGATIFPMQLGMASSWNPALLERVARATAVEGAAKGVHWTFSPVLCITRDLRWGRVGETFGEDPYLIVELASAMVRGYQGDGIEELMPDILNGTIEPGKVFDITTDMEGIAQGYKDMDEGKSLKVLIKP